MISPPLDPERLRRALAGMTFGHPLVYEQSLESTNDRALELLEAGYPEGTLVVAEEQTRGRGRRERSWVSPPRLGLYLSLLLRPALLPSRMPLLTFAAATGLARVLAGLTEESIRIQWPNDLLLLGKKVGGILAEGKAGATPAAAVVGVGLNVNQRATDFPSEIRERAVSLRIVRGRSWDRTSLLPPLLEGWEEEHRILSGGRIEETLTRWECFASFSPGSRLRVDLDGSVRTGRYRGLGAGGELRLEEDGGNVISLTFGEVRRVQEG